MSEKSQKYECFKCDYTTCRKDDFKKHCQTIKHKGSVEEARGVEGAVNLKTFECLICKKVLQTSGGLWKHKQKCNVNTQITNGPAPHGANDQIVNVLKAVLPPILENFTTQTINSQEFMKTQVAQLNSSQEMMLKLAEMFTESVKNLSNNTTNNTMNHSNNNSNNTNSNNNTFNLQIFLNETCKDAFNLSDFIKTITVDCKDIEEFNKKGYVDATCELIIKHLSALDVEKRPIHCTDAKRETVYVKENDKWEKEDDNYTKLQFLIDEVQKINLRVLKVWKDKHPGCLTSTSQYTDLYNNMSQELIGGFCHKVRLETKENRIKSKIARYVTIDKSQFI